MNKNNIMQKLNEYLAKQDDIVYANSIYQKMHVRREVTRTTASLRTIANNEIVIEFDSDNPKRGYVLAKKMMIKLKLNGYSFLVWKADGQRSPHIHVYNIKGLEKIDKDINREYKRFWFKKYCMFKETDVGINTKDSSLIAMEDKDHFKYGTKKTLLYNHLINNKLENTIDYQVLEQARESIIEINNKVFEERILTNDYDNTWFIEWVTKEKLPKGHRDNIILKNLAIYIVNNKIDDKGIIERLEKLYDNKVGSLMRSWKQWALRGKREFMFFEIQRFIDDNNLCIKDIFKKYRKEIDTDRKEIKYSKKVKQRVNRCIS